MRTLFGAALAAVAVASDIDTKFLQWIAEYGRSYGTVAEYKFRLERFIEKNTFIEEHNS